MILRYLSCECSVSETSLVFDGVAGLSMACSPAARALRLKSYSGHQRRITRGSAQYQSEMVEVPSGKLT